MRNPSKREIPHEKNKKNSARFPDNERYFHHFQEAKRPPRFQIISFLRQDERGVKIGLSPTPSHRRIFGAGKQPNGG